MKSITRPAFGGKYKVLGIMGILFLILNTYYIIPAHASSNLYNINQKVCNRFEDDLSKLAAIMEELRRRKGITETRVAFGGIDDAIKSADYQITYAAEAIAFQRAQKYSSAAQLRSSLQTLKGKILRARSEVGKALQ
ncbi:hypothetical protein HYS92_01425 [Candidatus Daviesbacteria bacterium]|nr:hypothetical protein [Candidatus Daviesbacteria bacterium]